MGKSRAFVLFHTIGSINVKNAQHLRHIYNCILEDKFYISDWSVAMTM